MQADFEEFRDRIKHERQNAGYREGQGQIVESIEQPAQGMGDNDHQYGDGDEAQQYSCVPENSKLNGIEKPQAFAGPFRDDLVSTTCPGFVSHRVRYVLRHS